MRASVLVSFSALLLADRALAADNVDDPLTAATLGGRGSRGGDFSPSGWKTTRGDDAVWYEIPDPLATASIEYEVTGMSVGGTLAGDDILRVYQAPTGDPEPIAYGPFRNNDLKALAGSAPPSGVAAAR